MFKRMEIAEQVYEGVTPSKTPIRADSNRDSHGRKRNGGEAASPTNTKKGHAINLRKKCRPSEQWYNRCNKDMPAAWFWKHLRECKVLKFY